MGLLDSDVYHELLAVKITNTANAFECTYACFSIGSRYIGTYVAQKRARGNIRDSSRVLSTLSLVDSRATARGVSRIAGLSFSLFLSSMSDTKFSGFPGKNDKQLVRLTDINRDKHCDSISTYD